MRNTLKQSPLRSIQEGGRILEEVSELEAEEERSEDEYKELVSDHARFLDSLKLVKQDEELKPIKKRLIRQALAELQAKYELTMKPAG